MEKIRGILCDIGGVLYVGDQAIDGAAEAIARLKAHFSMRFLTNTTRTVPQQIVAKLHRMGFAIEKNELYTALDATRNFLAARSATLLPVMTDEAEAYFADMIADSPDFVVVGDAYTNFDFGHLNRAFRALMGGARLVAAAKNRYFKDSDGALSMDAGGFVAALEYATGQEAQVIGKPSQTFFHYAHASMGLQAHEVIMVGDDVESDIAGAQRAGLKTALVKSGKFRPDDLEKGIRPDLILEDITELERYVIPQR